MTKKVSKQGKIILALHNVRSTHNVGAIFRTADGAGVAEIYLVGITPDPIDRFGRQRADIAKTALGAEDTVAWRHLGDADFLAEIAELKKAGYQIIAIEQGEKAVDYKKVKVEAGRNILFIVGSEVDGLPAAVTERAEVVAEIPLRGQKESLNVSVATGVALFRILNI